MKRPFFILNLAFGGVFLVFLYFSFGNFGLTRLPHTSPKTALSVDTPGCQIPAWDPFDVTIANIFKKIEGPYSCGGKPSFLILHPNSTLSVNKTILQQYFNLYPKDLYCFYQPIFRDSGSPEKPTDDKYIIGNKTYLKFYEPIMHDFIVVECFLEDSDLKVSSDYISLFPHYSFIKRKRKENISFKFKPLNIIFLGIDSVSQLNFVRHFPKTRKYLLETLQAIQLRGYTKVGENTFPNLTPLLTGHYVDWDRAAQENKFFDYLPFIWKDFAKIGYVTLFAEDCPTIATYNYLKNGFRTPPSDFYYRPMALAREDSQTKKESKDYCFGNKLETSVLFENLKNFIESFRTYYSYFAFTFVACVTHNQLNTAGLADEPSFDILQQLYTSGILNDSLLFFFSDHGLRFGDIRKTYIGHFEEKMPIAFLIFPEWFYHKYPAIYKNLKSNEGRLTSHFDIYATLKDYLNSILKKPMRKAEKREHGISLFKEIPKNRTCHDAGIPENYCPCFIHKVVRTDDPLVLSAAQVMISTLNEWLKLRPECSRLQIAEVLQARAGSSSDVFLSDIDKFLNTFNRRPRSPVDYLLTVRTHPGDGLFEGTVRYDPSTGLLSTLGEISRINRYGNQSACVDNAQLRKYCYCITGSPVNNPS